MFLKQLLWKCYEEKFTSYAHPRLESDLSWKILSKPSCTFSYGLTHLLSDAIRSCENAFRKEDNISLALLKSKNTPKLRCSKRIQTKTNREVKQDQKPMCQGRNKANLGRPYCKSQKEKETLWSCHWRIYFLSFLYGLYGCMIPGLWSPIIACIAMRNHLVATAGNHSNFSITR